MMGATTSFVPALCRPLSLMVVRDPSTVAREGGRYGFQRHSRILRAYHWPLHLGLVAYRVS